MWQQHRAIQAEEKFRANIKVGHNKESRSGGV